MGHPRQNFVRKRGVEWSWGVQPRGAGRGRVLFECRQQCGAGPSDEQSQRLLGVVGRAGVVVDDRADAKSRFDGQFPPEPPRPQGPTRRLPRRSLFVDAAARGGSRWR